MDKDILLKRKFLLGDVSDVHVIDEISSLEMATILASEFTSKLQAYIVLCNMATLGVSIYISGHTNTLMLYNDGRPTLVSENNLTYIYTADEIIYGTLNDAGTGIEKLTIAKWNPNEK